MSALPFPLEKNGLSERLSALARLYQQGQGSELMERTLAKLLTHEADVARAQLAELEADLAEYESRYDMPSAEFLRRFQSGQTDDRMDYVEWASLTQMADTLRQRLRLLTGEERG